MVIEQETRLDNIETELASLKATPTEEAIPTVEPTEKPEPFEFWIPESGGGFEMRGVANGYVTDIRHEVLNKTDTSCTLRLYIDGYFETLDAERAKELNVRFCVDVEVLPRHDPISNKSYKIYNIVPPSDVFSDFIVEIHDIVPGSYSTYVSASEISDLKYN